MKGSFVFSFVRAATAGKMYLSANFCNRLKHSAKRLEPPSLGLALGTKEGAAGGLHDPFDRTSTLSAWFAGAIVNAQPFLIKIWRVRRAAKIEKTIVFAFAGIIQRDGAAALNGIPKRLPDALAKAGNLRRF